MKTDFQIPAEASGVVVLVHGSGVTRRDAHMQNLARVLEQGGLATVATDLLEDYEANERHNALDVELQAARLTELVRRLRREPPTRALPVALLGTGIGAGIALAAAAKLPDDVSAVVCCGGRPDTASPWLASACVPTLFVTDGHAPQFTQVAYEHCAAPKELVRLPLQEAGVRAREWLTERLVSRQHEA